MGLIEILIVFIVGLSFLSVISIFIYKKIKGEPINSCDCNLKKGKDLVSEYFKKYPKNNTNKNI